MNVNLGGISPIELNVKSPSPLPQTEMPDILGIYQAARTQALQQEQIQAIIQKSKAEATKDLQEAETKKIESQNKTLEAKAKPFLDTVKVFLDNKQYDAAMNTFASALESPDFQNYMPQLNGKKFTFSPELQVQISADEQGRQIVTGINPQNGDVIYNKQVGGKVPNIVVGEKNIEAQRVRDMTDRNFQMGKRSEDQERADKKTRFDVVKNAKNEFTSSVTYKKQEELNLALRNIYNLANQSLEGNKAAPGQLRNAVAGLLQKGTLSDGDVVRSEADRSVAGRLLTQLNIMASGKPKADDIKAYSELANSLGSSLRQNVRQDYNNMLNSTVATLESMNLDSNGVDAELSDTVKKFDSLPTDKNQRSNAPGKQMSQKSLQALKSKLKK